MNSNISAINKALKHLLIPFGIFILVSCGGVIGSVKKYQLNNCNEKQVRSALNQFYTSNPEFVKKDTLLYGTNDSENYYFKLRCQNATYIFKCDIVEEKNSVPVELSLTAATKYGDVMKLAPKLTFKERALYINLFERTILPKLQKHLNCN